MPTFKHKVKGTQRFRRRDPGTDGRCFILIPTTKLVRDLSGTLRDPALRQRRRCDVDQQRHARDPDSPRQQDDDGEEDSGIQQRRDDGRARQEPSSDRHGQKDAKRSRTGLPSRPAVSTRSTGASVNSAFREHADWVRTCNELETEWQLRISMAVGSLLFVLLGAPVGILLRQARLLERIHDVLPADHRPLLSAHALRHQPEQGRTARARVVRSGSATCCWVSWPDRLAVGVNTDGERRALAGPSSRSVHWF